LLLRFVRCSLFAYRDKKVVGVFIAFSCRFTGCDDNQLVISSAAFAKRATQHALKLQRQRRLATVTNNDNRGRG
jgi:hypothetical protein